DGATWIWSVGAVGKVRRAILHKASEMGVSGREETTDLIIGVQEVVSNAIRHARGGPSGLPIRLKVNELDDGLCIELAYPGVEFDIEEAHEIASPDGGFGVPLILKTVDRIQYRRDGELNLVTLEKRLIGENTDEP